VDIIGIYRTFVHHYLLSNSKCFRSQYRRIGYYFDKKHLQNASSLTPALEREGVSPDEQRTADLRNLDNVLVRGVAWTAAVKWFTQGITWGVTIIVARLLVPSDYGIVGMAAIYINLLTLFSEFGIGTAVVTLQDLTEDQVSQLNMLSLLLGLLGFLISGAAAIPLGKFFHAPNLPVVVIVLSGGFVVSGLRTVPYSLLQKELRFKLLAVIEGLQGVVQAVVTLTFALLGFGYWALVLGLFSFSVTPTVLTLLWRRQSFALPRLSSVRKVLVYSRHILIGRLCWASYTNSDFIIAGRILGVAPLGAYTLAWTLALAPLDKLTTLVNRVTPSVFAKIQTDSEALRRYLRNITGGIALIVFPVTIGMALVAPEFIPFVLGFKWCAAVVPLQLLALHALISSNVILLSPLLNVIGEERLVMRNSVASLIILPISFYIGSHWGTVGIAAGWLVIYPFVQLPLFSCIFRRINLSRSEYLGALWPALSGCAVMAISLQTWKSVSSEQWPLYVRLVSEIFVGIVAYGLVLILLHRNYLRAILQFARTSRLRPIYTPPVPRKDNSFL
jgi:O-antigen/teichoic acid export membrane protein